MALRAAWLTDIHLDCVGDPGIEAFFRRVADRNPDVILVTGDITLHPDLEPHLGRLASITGCPVYFVLGNHDYWGTSIRAHRERLIELTHSHPRLHWVPASAPVRLTPATVLVGHDGWADARAGDYEGSRVLLTDYFVIEELKDLPPQERRSVMESLGDEAAASVRRQLEAIPDGVRTVVALSHFPPFREACWYDEKISTEEWLPHLACCALGTVLRDFMERRPDLRMLALCGHTHGGGEYRPLPDLRVLTGPARYGAPVVQRILELE